MDITEGHPQQLSPAPRKKHTWPWIVLAVVAAFILGGALIPKDDKTTAAAEPYTPSTSVQSVAPATTTRQVPDLTTAQITTAAPALVPSPTAITHQAPAAVTYQVPAPAPAAAVELAKPQVSSSQRNAVRSAQQYIDFSAFSRSGLIEQVEYEGFSAEDATHAADSLNVDWNNQAALSAKQYLKMTSFSMSGLIEQLEYEGFTSAQAEYGAHAAY